MKNPCLQDEGGDCSPGCMRAFVWEGRGWGSVPPIGTISRVSPFNEGSSLKNIILDSQVDGGGDFIQCGGFQALSGGKRKPKVGAT